jgi:molybdopterin-guanine dinucleotide biosynthesis protein A
MKMNSFIVLCGGKSRRMGQDKGSMSFHGKPMIIHVIETLTHVADEIVLVLRDKNQADEYKKFLKDLKLTENINFKICTDILKDQGPLAGILTGFQHIVSNKAMVLPCDSPFVSEFFVKKMFELSGYSDFDAFVPKWSDGRLEPLHSIYKKNSQPVIRKLLEEDILDVKNFITKLDVKFIDVESLDPTGRSFFNINQMKDIPKV